ncbi:hypothetical protein [Streptomyces sp. Ag109_O5-10]|uniref:hypothetical protein n=1 Tax=Streptomyces sp. Ag109_O5-10 TaxID=1855349 RepID=UPI000895CE63|nr:hypothetical protein [Streptomyces sp. Ag109_O5-10]SEE97740.1 hypothetical protein SAMN05216533_4840 [Streptomyces sp. Ag109_O5-10]
MSHFSYEPIDPGRPRPRLPEPRPAEPGRWPKLEAALAVVNRDLAATLPEQDALILMAEPPQESPPPGAVDRGRIYVAMPDGRWQGNQVNAHDPEEGDPLEPDDADTVLTAVADAAQETVMELLWQVWPVCWEHKTGMHVRPAGTADDRYPGATGASGPPVWWCRGGREGGGHDVAAVGELAATLPGKQRRALRRGERRRDGRR